VTEDAAGTAIQRLRSILAERVWPPDASLASIRDDFESTVVGMPVVDGVRWERSRMGGVEGEWCHPAVALDDAVILHFHGGGYTMGSSRTVRPLVSQLATSSAAMVFSPDYRLGPEHPYPAAVEDARAVYFGVRKLGRRRIAFTGDSAGGGLAIAALVRLRDEGVELPTCAAVMSPWTDLTLGSESLERNEALDPQVSRARLAQFAGMYVPDAADLTHATVSPVFADLMGLPPLLVQVGGDEALLDDGIRLVDAARANGLDATLSRWEGMIHVWHAFAPGLPQAVEALNEIGQWLREQWATFGG
jgi:epsilon-lactone hydrolase